jgi:hypothetical protein
VKQRQHLVRDQVLVVGWTSPDRIVTTVSHDEPSGCGDVVALVEQMCVAFLLML